MDQTGTTRGSAASTPLVLWSDRDANRASSAGELEPLASRGLVAIQS
ncbi:hypothetical protein WMF27_09085 [Sorangium sp. So ce281]